MSLPVGVGKSAILRAIQQEFEGTIGVIPTNNLIDQYRETYPDLNYVKGKDHYDNVTDYYVHKDLAKDGVSTIFNPMSLYTYLRPFKKDNVWQTNFKSDIVVIDEAHKLVNYVFMLTSLTFKQSEYGFPSHFESDLALLNWLLVAKQKNLEEYDAERIELVRSLIKKNPQDFSWHIETKRFYKSTETYLTIQPLVPPKKILNKLLNFKKIILMSATLFPSDIWDLGITDYQYLDVASPIHKERRQILYCPAPLPFNFRTRPADVANYISSVLTAYEGLNTIIHVSYSWSQKLKPFFPDALFNTAASKDATLKKFKKNGGVWFASGCAEGIDLPGEECRLTIIPIILKGNIKDPAVVKQLAKEKGQLKYELTAVKNLMQQAGRGTRGEDDFSTTVVGDRSFPGLIMRNRAYIPKSFLESIDMTAKITQEIVNA